MIITEKKNIVGYLVVQGEQFELLDLHPWKHNEIPLSLREYTFQFLSYHSGFATPIIVGRNALGAIIPYIVPMEVDVSFVVEEDDEVEIPEDRMSIVV